MDPTAARKPRMESLDCLRGLVMALMALDHARSHAFAGTFDPLSLWRTTASIFFTRWVTHFCAPLFVFLAGTSAFLFMSRGKTKAELSRYLLSRGAILLVFEIFYMSPWFTLTTDTILMQVLWALGMSMILLAGLIWLPEWAILAYGISMVLGHNLLDGIILEPASSFLLPWSLLHQPGQTIPLAATLSCRVAYPLIPWTGVMALGYLFGKVLLMEKDRRISVIHRLGIGLTLAFIVVRAMNIYGDPYPWSVQGDGIRTFLSFIKCEKYPPSLLFLLMTMGPGLILLGFMEKKIPRAGRPLLVFGSVPLFFYLIHLPVIIGLAALSASVLRGLPISVAAVYDPKLSLTWVYLIWFACLLFLYPACRWYSALKKEKNWNWMKYI